MPLQRRRSVPPCVVPTSSAQRKVLAPGSRLSVTAFGAPITVVVRELCGAGGEVHTLAAVIASEARVLWVSASTPVGAETPSQAPKTLYPRAVTGATLETVGGHAAQVVLILETAMMALRRPEAYTQLGLRPPRGMLLYGPPGTGKTLLARAVAGAIGCPVLVLNGPEVVSRYHGETEAKVSRSHWLLRRLHTGVWLAHSHCTLRGSCARASHSCGPSLLRHRAWRRACYSLTKSTCSAPSGTTRRQSWTAAS